MSVLLPLIGAGFASVGVRNPRKRRVTLYPVDYGNATAYTGEAARNVGCVRALVGGVALVIAL